MKKTAMNWKCDTKWEFPITVTDDQWTNGSVCITGEAIAKNFASKDQVAEYKKMIEEELIDRKAVDPTITK
jgi:hypothetical protein